MKARIDSSGEIVDVVYVPTGKRTGYYKLTNSDDWRSPDAVTIIGDSDPAPTDWQAYRMEVAEECMAAILRNIDEIDIADGAIKDGAKKLAFTVVQAADALINELKKTQP